jgi:hypothetical protein
VNNFEVADAHFVTDVLAVGGDRIDATTGERLQTVARVPRWRGNPLDVVRIIRKVRPEEALARHMRIA